MLRYLFVLVGLMIPPAFAGSIVLGDDGREVRLNDDGTWEYVSQDRYATTEDGERIRLKADGLWEPVTDDRQWVTVPAERMTRRTDIATAGDIQVELSDWRIESVRDRRKKNTTLRAQMVLEVTVTGMPGGQKLPLASQFTVTDSRGRQYTVEQVSRFMPGADNTRKLQLIVGGAPRWWGNKFFRLHLAPNALGNDRALELTKKMTDVVEADVETLTSF